MSFISFKIHLIVHVFVNIFHLFFIYRASVSPSSHIAGEWISLGLTITLLIFSVKLFPHHSPDGF